MLELHTGQLTWVPKTVIFEGIEYPAPLTILFLLTVKWIIEYLNSLKK